MVRVNEGREAGTSQRVGEGRTVRGLDRHSQLGQSQKPCLAAGNPRFRPARLKVPRRTKELNKDRTSHTFMSWAERGQDQANGACGGRSSCCLVLSRAVSCGLTTPDSQR